MDELLVDLPAVQQGLPVRVPDRMRRRNLLVGAAAAGAGAIGVAIGLRTFNPPSVIASIAVLPLENMSGDPEQEYFADGMTDALITYLSKAGALKVISRRTAMKYKGSQKPLKLIAQELNVGALGSSDDFDRPEARRPILPGQVGCTH